MFSFTSLLENIPLKFKIKPLFVYKNINYNSTLIEDAVNQWNVDNLFNYTYKPTYDVQILDPLKPSSYFNKAHRYNAFVIPQIDSINIKTMNKRA